MAQNPLTLLRRGGLQLDSRVWLMTYGQVLLSLGRGVLMPFATLYFYDVRHFPLALIGLAFAIALPLGSVVGLAWGALSDRIGRKPLMVFGFAGHAITTAALAFVTQPAVYVGVVILNAIAFSAWGPSSRAMVADVTSADKRTRAYGLLYLANNLGLSLGLLVGGLAALFLPYRAFFFAEAAGALGYLVVVAVFVRETHARRSAAVATGAATGAATSAAARLREHFSGLSKPMRDPLFLMFALSIVVAGLGWSQFYITYSPYLKDFIGASGAWIGFVFAINTVMVVGLQIPIAERVERMSRMRAYMIANYLLAWSLLLTWAAGRAGNLGAGLALMSVGTIIMTFGEIMVAPVGSSIAAGLAGSSDNFGKYMAAFDLTWTLSTGLGSIMGGAFFDAGRPMLLWPVATTFVVLSFAGFVWLARRLPPAVDRPAPEQASGPTAPAPGEQPEAS